MSSGDCIILLLPSCIIEGDTHRSVHRLSRQLVYHAEGDLFCVVLDADGRSFSVGWVLLVNVYVGHTSLPDICVTDHHCLESLSIGNRESYAISSEGRRNRRCTGKGTNLRARARSHLRWLMS